MSVQLRDRALTPGGVLAPGHRLGRYEILAKLASGGMAIVYVASAQGAAGFERLVALKVLHANLAHEDEFIRMFLDEARLASRIRHPNVVATTDISDTIETGYFLVMEYIEGDHLGGLLSSAHRLNAPMPVPVVLRVAIDTLSGLGAAHDLRDEAGRSQKLVHRDVSPHNILVGRDGIARLTDFGVAKAEDRLTHTRDGQVKGKLAYMAPEQASSGATDSRSDLFSAGIILWECVTGRRLFRAENTAATLVKLLNEPIVLPSAVDPDLAPLDPVLKKALDRDPNARFQTAEEFVEALEWAAPRMGGVASRRAVTKAVKQYAGDKLARERKLIEAAQRALRGGAGEPLTEGSEPPPSPAGEVSLPSSSMSRSKPSGVFSNLTAPRLFTRGRTARPSQMNLEAPPAQGALAPPPPLGQFESERAVPEAPPDLPIGVPSNGGRLLIAIAVVIVLAAGSLTARSWFSREGLRARSTRELPQNAGAAATEPPAAAAVPPAAASLPVSVVEVPKQAAKVAPAPAPAAPVDSVTNETPRRSHSGSSSAGSRGSGRGSRGSGRVETQGSQQSQQSGGSERKAGPVLPNPYTH